MEGEDTLWVTTNFGFGVRQSRIELTAAYADGTVKTVTKDIHTVAPYGQLQEPDITASSLQQQGWDMEFDVDRHEGEWWWSVSVLDESGTELQVWDADSHPGWTHFALATDDMSGLYRIAVYAAGLGYNEAYTTFEFKVIGELTTSTLPAQLTVIEEEAFAGAKFEKVVIPAAVTEIGSRAFADCSNLQAIVILGNPDIAEDAFSGGVASRTFFAAEGSAVWAWLEQHGCWVEPLTSINY